MLRYTFCRVLWGFPPPYTSLTRVELHSLHKVVRTLVVSMVYTSIFDV